MTTRPMPPISWTAPTETVRAEIAAWLLTFPGHEAQNEMYALLVAQYDKEKASVIWDESQDESMHNARMGQLPQDLLGALATAEEAVEQACLDAAELRRGHLEFRGDRDIEAHLSAAAFALRSAAALTRKKQQIAEAAQ